MIVRTVTMNYVRHLYQLVQFLLAGGLDDLDEIDLKFVEDILSSLLSQPGAYLFPAHRDALFKEVEIFPLEGVGVFFFVLTSEFPDFFDVEGVGVAEQ